MYRFLATPRWLGLAALALLLATVMVGLGNWQLQRYHARAAINARIDAGGSGPAVPIARTSGAATPPGRSDLCLSRQTSGTRWFF